MSDDLLTRRGTMKMIPGATSRKERPPYLRPVPTEQLPHSVLVAPPAPDAIHHTSRAPERHAPFVLGDRIGVYGFLGHLGEGGMSYVYEVRHAHTGQTFALKCLNEQALARPRLVERFVGEGKVLAYLSAHPHVVRVHEVGEDPRTGPFVVMEKLAGKTLRQVLEEIQRKGERMHRSPSTSRSRSRAPCTTSISSPSSIAI